MKAVKFEMLPLEYEGDKKTRGDKPEKSPVLDRGGGRI